VILNISLSSNILAMEINKGISFIHELPENIKIKTSYWSDYDSTTWKITDNKNIWIQLEVLDNPNNLTILIEHLHADCSLEAKRPGLDGILQDTMDDKIHEGDQPGFYVSVDHPYYECFLIEGYSKWLIDGWIFYFSGYGAGGVVEERLTETNVRNRGVVGSEISVVYDVLIKDPSTGLYYKYIIHDDFIVYLNGSFEQNLGGTGEKEEVEETKANNKLLDLIVGLIFFILGVVLLLLGVHKYDDALAIVGACSILIGIIFLIVAFVV